MNFYNLDIELSRSAYLTLSCIMAIYCVICFEAKC